MDFLLYDLDDGVVNQHEDVLNFDEFDHRRPQVLGGVSLRVDSEEALFLGEDVAQKRAVEMPLRRRN